MDKKYKVDLKDAGYWEGSFDFDNYTDATVFIKTALMTSAKEMFATIRITSNEDKGENEEKE